MRVTERHGITALTLEAAAEEAGLTKPGLMYHFRTRDDLLMAIQRHLTGTWEQYLLAELGKPLEESTAQERAAAYARVNAHGSASKAELAFMVESAASSELAQVWNDLTLTGNYTEDHRIMLRLASTWTIHQAAAVVDAAYPKYPPQPIVRCPGYQPRDETPKPNASGQ